VREGERSDNIYVLVDSSKVARCKWCGITESEKWIPDRNRVFCSQECWLASNATAPIWMLIPGAFVSLLLAAFGSIGLSASLAFLGFGSVFLCCSIPALNQRRAVPKNSRANEVLLDTALLATVSAPVACPRCDANLDLRKIGKDRVYICDHCGATGTITVVIKSEQRRSGSGGSI